MRIFCFVLLVLLVGCSHRPRSSSFDFLGNIWDATQQKFISVEELKKRLNLSKYILLGETHDNSEHHRLQAMLISHILPKGTVILEMLETDHLPVINDFERGKVTQTQFFKAVKWEEDGWPPHAIYAPILNEVSAGWVLRPGLFNKRYMRSALRGDYRPFFTSKEIDSLKVVETFSKEMTSNYEENLNQAHCGALSSASIKKIAKAQRAKDAFMANQMLLAKKPAVLVSGSGHVRNDWGVPWYLKNKGVSKSAVTSVSFIEVSEETSVPPQAYVQEHPSDIMWFTKRQDRMDPCVEFSKKGKVAGP